MCFIVLSYTHTQTYAKKKNLTFVPRSGCKWGFPGGSVVTNPSNNAGDTGDVGSIPGPGRSPGGGNGNPLQYLAWNIPWTEEPSGLRSIGSQRVGHDHAAEHTAAAAAAAKSLQSCPILCDPIDGSPPGSPVPGILPLPSPPEHTRGKQLRAAE